MLIEWLDGAFVPFQDGLLFNEVVVVESRHNGLDELEQGWVLVLHQKQVLEVQQGLQFGLPNVEFLQEKRVQLPVSLDLLRDVDSEDWVEDQVGKAIRQRFIDVEGL